MGATSGITNKKDLLDAAYVRYDEEFPRESEFEEEFNGCIQLVTNLVTEQNATLIKTKSNFYSIFGACLLYLRAHKRKHFLDISGAQGAVTTVLAGSKSFDPENPGTAQAEVSEYYDAVSRAATDKSRRVRREGVLWTLIKDK